MILNLTMSFCIDQLPSKSFSIDLIELWAEDNSRLVS